MNSPSKILNKQGGGGARLFLEYDRKHGRAKSKALEIYFQKFCSKSNIKKTSVQTLTQATALVAPEVVTNLVILYSSHGEIPILTLHNSQCVLGRPFPIALVKS